jgi:transcriptional regulator with XRE-family HTH domain
MDIGDKIRHLRKERNWSQEQLCERAEIDRVTLSYIENHKRNPEYRTVEKIAHGFGITVSELTGYEGGRAGYAGDMISGGQIGEDPGIPLLGYVEAGKYAISYTDGEYPTGIGMGYVDRGRIKDRNAYAVIVQGDSMLPTLRPGYIVVTSPNSEVVSNDIVICRLRQDEEVVTKRIRLKGNMIILESDNKAFETMILTKDEVLFYHKVAAIYPT